MRRAVRGSNIPREIILSPDQVSLGPSPLPTDLVPSALFLPLASVSADHRNQKIRTIGQILAYDTKSSLLLLTAPQSGSSPLPASTVLVDISVPLLGDSPAVIERKVASAGAYSRQGLSDRLIIAVDGEGGAVPRDRVRSEKGEWVCVVGWLDGEERNVVYKGKRRKRFADPLPLVLEAIHISSTRPPPIDAIYPGHTVADSAGGAAHNGTASRPVPRSRNISYPRVYRDGRGVHGAIIISDSDSESESDDTSRAKHPRPR